MHYMYIGMVFTGGITEFMKGAVFTLSACMSLWGLYVLAVTQIFSN